MILSVSLDCPFLISFSNMFYLQRSNEIQIPSTKNLKQQLAQILFSSNYHIISVFINNGGILILYMIYTSPHDLVYMYHTLKVGYLVLLNNIISAIFICLFIKTIFIFYKI